MANHEILPGDDPIPFFPKHFWTEFKVAMVMLAVAVAVAVLPFFRAEPGLPADPLNTPVGIKPEWYFLAIYEVIKYIPKLAGVLLPLVLVGLLFVLPFIDFRPDTSRRPTHVRAAITVVGLVLFVALTYMGSK